MRQNLDLFGDMLDTFNPRRVIALAMIDGNTPSAGIPRSASNSRG
jgi:hypothetical protein